MPVPTSPVSHDSIIGLGVNSRKSGKIIELGLSRENIKNDFWLYISSIRIMGIG
ncbi:MAG: hypothetical protein WED07_00740 [Candidatus Freyarchaeum deiterrae]